jgi:hypothetical protein
MSTPADLFFQYRELSVFLQQSPAVKMLRSSHAAMSISFLYKMFRGAGKPTIPLEALTHRLSDYLSTIGFMDEGDAQFPGYLGQDYYDRAAIYIKRWAEDENRYLYINLDDKTHEPYASLSRFTEKVFQVLEQLREKEFVGTESKLLDLFGKVQELVQRTSDNPDERIRELQARKRNIDEEIKLIRKTGEVPVYEPWQIKSRWADIERLAGELTGDFREVEENFKEIYKTISHRHADATLSKGQILRLTFDALEELRSNDQGRSFYAFWEFLMDEEKQQAFSAMLQQLYDLLDKTGVEYPNRQLLQLKYILHNAGIKVLHTNELLGYKLSRIVVEKEKGNRRKTRDIVNKILQHAIQQTERVQKAEVVLEADDRPAVYLPLERKLGEKPTENQFGKAPNKAALSLEQLTGLHRLMDDGSIDKTQMIQNIKHLLKARKQVALSEVLVHYPCTRGLAEALAYVSIATTLPGTAILVAEPQDILFDPDQQKYLQMPKIIFTR